jgi:hypothetical protein
MRKGVWTAVAVVLFASLLAMQACTFPWLFGPRVIDHPRPELTVDMEPFREVGCTPEEWGVWTCPDNGPLAEFDCQRLREPSDLLGGLTPQAAIMICEVGPDLARSDVGPYEQAEQIREEGILYSSGCMFPSFVRYVVARDGEFTLVKDRVDFQAAFAPVESANEALSFALAVTGHTAGYEHQVSRDLRYHTETLEDTHVEEAEGGYVVNLRSYALCGCGPHTTSEVVLLVTPDGEVSQQEVTPLYADPEEDDLCVD